MPVGRTKDAGWQIGVSITVPVDATTVWEWLVSPEGLATWLGAAAVDTAPGTPYETTDGTCGEVRSFRPGDRIRLTWQPADWPHDSTVQVALDDKGDRTRIVFHQERLAGPDERERQRAHWKTVSEFVRRALTEEENNGG